MLIVLLLAFGLVETDTCGLWGFSSGASADEADMVLGVSVNVGGGESVSWSSTTGGAFELTVRMAEQCQLPFLGT
jgi:hypothetical protein